MDRIGAVGNKMTADTITDTFSKLRLTEKSSVSLEAPDDEYLMHVASQKSGGDVKVAVTGSSHAVRVYTRQNLALCSTMTGHSKGLTGIIFTNASDNLLYTSSLDSTIRLWDFRKSSEKCVQTFQAPEPMPFTALGLSCNDRCLVAGTEAKEEDVFIFFWDTRMDGDAALGYYTESHQGDITQVVLHPHNKDRMITSSTDGLVSLFDISQETEDDALLTSFNTESSVSKVGWCGPGGEHIFATTHIDSLHVWSAIDDFDDIAIMSRDEVKEKTRRQTDYLVDCFDAVSSGNLHVVGGTSDGIVQVYQLDGNELCHVKSLSKGHSSLVRCSHWHSQTKTLVTGGEDSMLCLWSTDASSTKTADVVKRQAKAPSKMKTKLKNKHSKSKFSKPD